MSKYFVRNQMHRRIHRLQLPQKKMYRYSNSNGWTGTETQLKSVQPTSKITSEQKFNTKLTYF